MLVEAFVALSAAALCLRWFGFRRVHAALDRWLPAVRPDAVAAGERAVELSRAVGRAARRAPGRPGCLPSALVLWGLLRTEGIGAQLRFGVRRDESCLEAHAWVECAGRTLEPSPVGAFAALQSAGAARAGAP